MEGTVSMVFGDMGDSHNKEKKIFVKCAKELWGAVDETTVTLLWFTLGIQQIICLWPNKRPKHS